ncbi:MAG: site-2 protease family protein [Deltaproteobacteria bacterium]|jgi:Zn-dependent protease|nr:site-2 protease family protein [Deltaproteobacteria bacterium]MBW2520290.1 site-2 protease family protein [Deltaproteobacteria bacterium]
MENILLKISIMLVPALLAVTAHEVAHGFAAERFGDPTARLLGRLTLNPIKHLDPIGTIALLVFGFGWARPVPVNPNNLRRSRLDMTWVALAGPSANLMLALCCAVLLRGVVSFAMVIPQEGQLFAMIEPVALMAAFGLYINVILGVFNLLPIPPLDGGRIIMNVLPEKQALMFRKIEPFGLLLIIFLVFGTSLWQDVLGPLVFSMVALLAGPQIDVVERTMHLLFYS